MSNNAKREELDSILCLFEQFTDYFAGFSGVNEKLEAEIYQQILQIGHNLDLLEKCL